MNKKGILVVATMATAVMLFGCGHRAEGSSTSATTGSSTQTTTPSTPSTNPPQDNNQSTAGYLTKDITKVDISYKPAKPNPQTIQRTITDPAQIAKLVDAINAVPQGVMGFNHCVQDYGQQAIMDFYPSSGQPIKVSAVPSCSHLKVGNLPMLTDTENAVFKAVAEIMGQ